MVQVVEDPRPRIRYAVGRDARLYSLALKLLPESLADFLVASRVPYGASRPARRIRPPSAGDTVLVTGANSGIGLAVCGRLAQAGLRVYAGYRSKSRSAALFSLSRAFPVHPLPLDVDRDASVRAAVRMVLHREGRLDGLVANAGFAFGGFQEDLSAEELEAQFETNVFGVLRAARAALPAMRRRGSGWVAVMGSIVGRVGFPGLSAYSASKHAVRSLTDALRLEAAAFGVSVFLLEPGSHRTNVLASARYARRHRRGWSVYAPFAEVLRREAERRLVSEAAPPENVAEALWDILKRGRPPARRRVGFDARVLALLKRRLPDSWFEALFRRFFPWVAKRPDFS